MKVGVEMAVSFGSRIAINPETGRKDKNGVRVTKQGNPYYKTNVGKKVGVTTAAVGLAASTLFNSRILGGKAALAIGAMYAPITIIGSLIGGAIFDAAMNHHEKKKADAMAPYNA